MSCFDCCSGSILVDDDNDDNDDNDGNDDYDDNDDNDDVNNDDDNDDMRKVSLDNRKKDEPLMTVSCSELTRTTTTPKSEFIISHQG